MQQVDIEQIKTKLLTSTHYLAGDKHSQINAVRVSIRAFVTTPELLEPNRDFVLSLLDIASRYFEQQQIARMALAFLFRDCVELVNLMLSDKYLPVFQQSLIKVIAS